MLYSRKQAIHSEVDSHTPNIQDIVKTWLPAVPREIKLFQAQPEELAALCKQLGRQSKLAVECIAKVLLSRNITKRESIADFLVDRELIDRLPKYTQIKNLSAAATCLLKHIRLGTKIGIVGDYDADGITATSQLVLALRALNYEHNIDWKTPDRFKDGYGINQNIADEMLRSSCRLFILLDHGTKSNQIIDYLRSKGAEVIVIDHHLPGDLLPECILVNPEQGGCIFQQHKLSAAGLTAYLTLALEDLTGQKCTNLYLAAVGTIADRVPMFGVNRMLAKQGLNELRSIDFNPVIQLADLMQIDRRQLNSEDIGYKIGPALNASGRVAQASLAVQLLISRNPEEILKLAQQLVTLNEERKQLQLQGNFLCEQKLLQKNVLPGAIIVDDPDLHAGVVGLNSSHLSERYGRPSGVAAVNALQAVASFRQGDQRVSLVGLLNQVNNSEQKSALIRYGGHHAAAGATIRTPDLDDFQQAFTQAFFNVVGENQPQVEVTADLELPLSRINARLLRAIDQTLAPYGQDFDPPTVLVKGLELIQFLKSQRSISAIVSDGSKNVMARFALEVWNADLNPGDCIDIIARPVMIYKRQKQHVQLMAQAYVKSSKLGIIKQLELKSADFAGDFREWGVVPPASNQEAGQQYFDFMQNFTANQLDLTDSAIKPASARKNRNRLISKPASNKVSQIDFSILKERAQAFPTGFLYPDIVSHFVDPFSSQSVDFKPVYQQFVVEQQLDLLKPNCFEYRDYQSEFVRFYANQHSNIIVDGPTGSGKTEIALFLAAKSLKSGSNVLFVAPTREIARQTYNRAKAAFNESVRIEYLDGSIAPNERADFYGKLQNTLCIAVPHAIKNDIASQKLKQANWHLLLVDEGHFTRGNYPYTKLIEASREIGARVVLFSGTPGEPSSTKLKIDTWDKIDYIDRLLGEDAVHYPLCLRPKLTKLTASISDYKDWQSRNEQTLSAIVGRLANNMLERINELGLDRLADSVADQPSHALKQLVGKKLDQLPGGYGFSKSQAVTVFKELCNLEPEVHGLISQLFLIKEIGELYRRLSDNGIYSTLIGAVEQLSRVYIPAGEKTPSYLYDFFENYQVKAFLISISRGPFFGIWNNREAFIKALDLDDNELKSKSYKQQKQLRRAALVAFKENARTALSAWDYSDSPREEKLFKILSNNASKSVIVFVKEREQVNFLVSRINQLSNRKAVGVMGQLGKRSGALSSGQDRSALEQFHSGVANVLVCTSVVEQGVDFKNVDIGINYNFNAALIDALQRAGRLGRGSNLGELFFVIASGVDQGKFKIVNKKYLLNIDRLVADRQKLLERYGEVIHNNLKIS